MLGQNDDIGVIPGLGLQSPPTNLLRRTIYNVAGTYNWAKGYGTTKVFVTAMGGSGGGSGGGAGAGVGGGGAGGGYADGLIDVSSIANVTVTVGIAGVGTGGSPSLTCSPAGTSSFGSYIISGSVGDTYYVGGSGGVAAGAGATIGAGGGASGSLGGRGLNGADGNTTGLGGLICGLAGGNGGSGAANGSNGLPGKVIIDEYA